MRFVACTIRWETNFVSCMFTFCNKLQLQIKHPLTNPDLKIQLHEQKNNHLQRASFIDRHFRDQVDNSKLSGGSKIVLVFDLEKVFVTPKLNTNTAYYKRKLSTYNFCVHDETNNRTYMYVWHEALASRGPQEITSCLIYHFEKYIPESCTEIVLYSDSCGGQNRNIKTSLMLSHLLDRSRNITTIAQFFFLSGHSYNVCDRKFSIIERKRRQVNNIYTPTEWKQLIENSKITLPKFTVTEMDKTSFKSCSVLESVITNRKRTTTKESLL